MSIILITPTEEAHADQLVWISVDPPKPGA